MILLDAYTYHVIQLVAMGELLRVVMGSRSQFFLYAVQYWGLRTWHRHYALSFFCIWCNNMDQAQPTGEHRIYAQTCTCTNSFGFFSSLFLIIFLCSSIRLTQLILLQRRFFGQRYRGRLFFRADRSLGAKQEGLTIVFFLNKLIVSCKEAVRFPF